MSSPPVAVPAGGLPPSARYRHPGDVIRLISVGLLLAVVVAASRVSQAASIGTWPSQGPSGRMDGCIPADFFENRWCRYPHPSLGRGLLAGGGG